MSKTLEILRRAKQLISKPENWTTKKLARNPRGEACGYYKPDAVRFCAQGALLRAARELDGWGDYAGASIILSDSTPSKNAIILNDQGPHEAVLAMFDRAITTAADNES